MTPPFFLALFLARKEKKGFVLCDTNFLGKRKVLEQNKSVFFKKQEKFYFVPKPFFFEK
jgi:hypothetical protein